MSEHAPLARHHHERRGAFLSIALAVSWMLCACTTSPAVESLCSNGNDDDNDNLWDCRDPDCQASDDCLGASAAEITPSLDDGGHRRPPLLDAGRHSTELGDPWIKMSDAEADATLPDARAIDPGDEDAGDPDPCTLCAVDEACVDAKCQPAASATSGAYSLRLLSGVVPTSDAIAFCYDSCLISPIAGLCNCPPDPYVRIVLRHDGKEALVGTTDVVPDTMTPRFPPVNYPVDLALGDVLRLEVYDHDEPPDQDDLLYTCRVDLRGISGSEAPMDMAVDCLGLAGIAGGMPFRIMAELLASTAPR